MMDEKKKNPKENFSFKFSLFFHYNFACEIFKKKRKNSRQQNNLKFCLVYSTVTTTTASSQISFPFHISYTNYTA